MGFRNPTKWNSQPLGSLDIKEMGSKWKLDLEIQLFQLLVLKMVCYLDSSLQVKDLVCL